jgi:nitroreductase
MGWETEKHSVAAAIQNMLLKAYSLGLGSLWIGDVFFTVEALEQHLGKPWKILAAVTLGYPAHVPKGPRNGRSRKSVDEVGVLALGYFVHGKETLMNDVQKPVWSHWLC